MTKPPTVDSQGCFTNANPPTTPDQAVDRIAQMIGMTIVDQQWRFDESTFTLSPRDTWNHHWGKALVQHFTPQAWTNEWRNVAVIATVHGCRAVDFARERGHEKGVTEQDFVDAGLFAARCCKQCYFKNFNLKEACWCNTDC